MCQHQFQFCHHHPFGNAIPGSMFGRLLCTRHRVEFMPRFNQPALGKKRVWLYPVFWGTLHSVVEYQHYAPSVADIFPWSSVRFMFFFSWRLALARENNRRTSLTTAVVYRRESMKCGRGISRDVSSEDRIVFSTNSSKRIQVLRQKVKTVAYFTAYGVVAYENK
jgi:hypothetical protein